MRVGVIQSSYIPWRGYFDFIRQVDLFVIYDDVQFSKGSWRNRNQIKTPSGLKWLTVPVRDLHLGQPICQTFINYSIDWRTRHLNQFEENYREAPHYGDARKLLELGFKQSPQTITELNTCFTDLVCSYLGIVTPIRMSTEFNLKGSRTNRLIDLFLKIGAKTYLSGPSAKDYLDEGLFLKHGIRLEYKSYAYSPYPQLWGPFQGAVTILDMIANCGRDAERFLTSAMPNELAVP